MTVEGVSMTSVVGLAVFLWVGVTPVIQIVADVVLRAALPAVC